MAMPDPVKAVMTLLAADTDIDALVDARVFGGELPESEVASMSRACLVVREAGGNLLGTSWQPYSDVRLDVFAYGATARQSSELGRAVHRCLKLLTRTLVGGTLVYWARQDGGPIPQRDADTTWPYVWSSWQVLVAEVAA